VRVAFRLVFIDTGLGAHLLATMSGPEVAKENEVIDLSCGAKNFEAGEKQWLRIDDVTRLKYP
jgi:hypothetical protein